MPLPVALKSDNLIFVKKTMTATEVARNFSSVLDAVEAGDEVEITRGKKVIATLKSTARPKTFGSLIEAVKKHHEIYGPLDDEGYEIMKEVIADRDAPYNQVGGEFYEDPWRD
jgi:antitoxin (DNA-binding transcriptional repressor) of toxin-antitoxin stability system